MAILKKVFGAVGDIKVSIYYHNFLDYSEHVNGWVGYPAKNLDIQGNYGVHHSQNKYNLVFIIPS